MLPASIRKPLGRALLRQIQYRRAAKEARTLRKFRGIIHVGGNLGQEQQAYGIAGLNVLWIEPIPAVFARLKASISRWPKQKALNYLVLDEDRKDVTLHISNLDGAASSVLDMAGSLDIWPDVTFQSDLQLTGYTLDTIIDREGIDVSLYDAAILDTQGSELMVLKGAARVLHQINYIQVEAADFEAYKGCPYPKDIAAYLSAFGFCEIERKSIGKAPHGGQYWEIAYSKAQ